MTVALTARKPRLCWKTQAKTVSRQIFGCYFFVAPLFFNISSSANLHLGIFRVRKSSYRWSIATSSTLVFFHIAHRRYRLQISANLCPQIFIGITSSPYLRQHTFVFFVQSAFYRPQFFSCMPPFAPGDPKPTILVVGTVRDGLLAVSDR